MAAGIDMAFETPLLEHESTHQILVNVEINRLCKFTSLCSTNCFLNLHSEHLTAEPLNEYAVMNACTEFIESAAGVRHFCLAGKEPLETPELLFSILKTFHATPVGVRPLTIGAITADQAGLSKYREEFQEFPLDWLVVSLDASSSGLRSVHHTPALLERALELREIGGANAVVANTTFSDHNVSEVIDLGHQVERAGANQWSVCQFMVPRAGRMQHQPTAETTKHLIKQIVQQFGDGAMQVTIEVDLATIEAFLGSPHDRPSAYARWRLEAPIASRVRLICRNPIEKFFIRLRWDGSLLNREDFMRLNTPIGAYGSYERGRVASVMSNWKSLAPKRTFFDAQLLEAIET